MSISRNGFRKGQQVKLRRRIASSREAVTPPATWKGGTQATGCSTVLSLKRPFLSSSLASELLPWWKRALIRRSRLGFSCYHKGASHGSATTVKYVFELVAMEICFKDS